MVKKTILFLVVSCFITCLYAKAQTIDFNRQNIGRFVQRMYENEPFENVIIVDLADVQYIVATLSLDPLVYDNVSVMNRIASTKANSMIAKYVHGSLSITRTKVDLVRDTDSLIVSGTWTEEIRESTMGQVRAVDLLASFNCDKRKVFIFGTQINNE